MSAPLELPEVTLFTRPQCHLCHAAAYVIERVALEIPLHFVTVNIDEAGREQWRTLYTHHIPVVHINGREHARHRVDERALREALRAVMPPDVDQSRNRP